MTSHTDTPLKQIEKPFQQLRSATLLQSSTNNQIALTSSFSSKKVLAETLKSVNLLSPEQRKPEFDSFTALSTTDQAKPALALSENTLPAT